MKKLLAAAACSFALAFAGPASSATVSFSFGDILSPVGGYDPVPSFANLSVTTLDATINKNFLFTLTVGTNFASLFGTGAFVSKAIFNTASGADPVSTSITGAGNGVTTVKFSATAPQVGSVGFDFAECFGAKNCSHGGSAGRLQSGEQVSWVASFTSSQGDPFRFNIPGIALHVQGIQNQNISSGWYTPTPAIPEPETYAMMLAGLGLMGYVARRRRQQAAVS